MERVCIGLYFALVYIGLWLVCYKGSYYSRCVVKCIYPTEISSAELQNNHGKLVFVCVLNKPEIKLTGWKCDFCIFSTANGSHDHVRQKALQKRSLCILSNKLVANMQPYLSMLTRILKLHLHLDFALLLKCVYVLS